MLCAKLAVGSDVISETNDGKIEFSAFKEREEIHLGSS